MLPALGTTMNSSYYYEYQENIGFYVNANKTVHLFKTKRSHLHFELQVLAAISHLLKVISTDV